MPQFMQLPPYTIGNALDTSGLGNAIDQFGNVLKENRVRQQDMAIGNRLATGDYQGATADLFRLGRHADALNIKKFKSAEDAAADAKRKELVKSFGSLAQRVLDEEDGPARDAKTKKFMAVPNLLTSLPEAYRSDPNAALEYVASQAFPDPLEREKTRAEIAELKARHGAKSGTKYEKTSPGDKIVAITPDNKATEIYSSGPDPKGEDTLRKEHEGLTKNFREVQTGVRELETAYEQNNSIGDIGMVYSLVKALDPGSVVREAEFGFVTNASGPVQAIIQRINSFWDGKRLDPDMREQMVKYGRASMATRQQEYDMLTSRIQGIAQQRGVDPARSALDFRVPSSLVPKRQDRLPAEPAPNAAPAPAPGIVPPVPRQPPPQMPPRAAAPPGSQGQIPPGAVKMLQENPTQEMIEFFEEKYKLKPGGAQQFLMRR